MVEKLAEKKKDIDWITGPKFHIYLLTVYLKFFQLLTDITYSTIKLGSCLGICYSNCPPASTELAMAGRLQELCIISLSGGLKECGLRVDSEDILYIYSFAIMILLRVKAKSLLCYWAVRDLGIGMAQIARRLNLSLTISSILKPKTVNMEM